MKYAGWIVAAAVVLLALTQGRQTAGPMQPVPVGISAMMTDIGDFGVFRLWSDGAVDFLGIDLNGDGDFDDPGEFPPDPQCTSPSKNRERPTPPGGRGPGCGAGAELVLLLGAGLWWRWQRVGRTYSTA